MSKVSCVFVVACCCCFRHTTWLIDRWCIMISSVWINNFHDDEEVMYWVGRDRVVRYSLQWSSWWIWVFKRGSLYDALFEGRGIFFLGMMWHSRFSWTSIRKKNNAIELLQEVLNNDFHGGTFLLILRRDVPFQSIQCMLFKFQCLEAAVVSSDEVRSADDLIVGCCCSLLLLESHHYIVIR